RWTCLLFCSTLLVNTASTTRGMIPAVRLDRAAFAVHVARPYPVGETVIRAVLLASLRRHIQDSIGGEELFASAAETRVGEVDSSAVILEEDALAGKIRDARRPFRGGAEIVDCAAGGDLVRREGHVEIVIEVGAIGGDPRKLPAHALAHHFDLLDGRARHDCVGDVVIVEVRQNAFNVVDLEGAADALRLGAGPHHEVLDDDLAAAMEELR